MFKTSLLWIVVVAFSTMAIPVKASDQDAREISYCIGVFYYAAQIYMFQNNEGAAKVMTFQGSRATVTQLSMFYRDGRVSGETLSQYNLVPQAKADLDANIDSLPSEIDRCHALTNRLLANQEAKGITMWGKSLQEVIAETNSQTLRNIGLQ